ncbi:MliC family protein [Marinospirillum sp.]|uniref:MliC family protein n=1 Tax=Marinospirillum sp. TaxID=2183934 RepID=UPI003A8926E5
MSRSWTTSWMRHRRWQHLGWACLLSLLLAGCQSTPIVEEISETSLWRCDQRDELATRFQGEHLWLMLPGSDEWLHLQAARAASGALYRDAASGTSFWNRGERARVDTPEHTWMNCQLTEVTTRQIASLPYVVGTDRSPQAVTLRASGHHPGWRLEVRQAGTAELSFRFGTQRLTLEEVTLMDQDLIESRYRAQTQAGEPLHYQVQNILCIDAISGEPLPHRVEIHLEGQVYRGCGQSF